MIDDLEPGEYNITVKATGLKALQRTSIRLSPSERMGLGNSRASGWRS